MNWSHALKHGHFSPAHDAALRDPFGELLDTYLMQLLDEAREEAGVPFVCTSGFRSPADNARAGGAKDSPHLPDQNGRGRAIDGYFVGWPVFEQFIHLVRFPFLGVGAYPYPPPGRQPGRVWTPVVHVDRRDRQPAIAGTKLLWIRDAAGVYRYWPSDEFRIELVALARGVEIGA